MSSIRPIVRPGTVPLARVATVNPHSTAGRTSAARTGDARALQVVSPSPESLRARAGLAEVKACLQALTEAWIEPDESGELAAEAASALLEAPTQALPPPRRAPEDSDDA